MEDPTDTSVLIAKRPFLDLRRYVFIPTPTPENVLLYATLLIADAVSAYKAICDDIFESIEWAAKRSDTVAEPLILLTPDSNHFLYRNVILPFSLSWLFLFFFRDLGAQTPLFPVSLPFFPYAQ